MPKELESKKTLLVIGGTGFFGKSILDLFQRSGLDEYNINKVIVVARRVDAFKMKYPELCIQNVEFVTADISKCTKIPEADFVIHAASSTDARDYIYDSNAQRSNIEASIVNYAKLAHKYHKNAMIVYCSSGAVYGQQPENVEFIDEDFPFQDVSKLVAHKRDYALGKRLAENEVMRLGADGLNVSIARCFAFYGNYLPRDQHFAYGNFLGAAERGETIEVKANYQVFRSYMHADDLVKALIRIALDARPSCPIYNVGSDVAIEIRELARLIAKNKNVDYHFKDPAPGLIDRYVPNTNKLKSIDNNSIINL